MLGVEDYGSDVDSDDGATSTPSTTTKQAPQASKAAMKLPAPKSSKKRDGPVRIVIDLPKASNEPGDEEERALKRARVEPTTKRTPAGSSSLFSMLPAPKKAVPVAPTPERALGGAAQGGGTGLIFGETANRADAADNSTSEAFRAVGSTEKTSDSATAFRPPSVVKANPKTTQPPKPAAVSKPTVDFFSLGTVTKDASSNPTTLTSNPSSSSISISSAPVVQEYEPPPPTPNDPYPGYYQLPSGTWAAYDPAFYKSHWDSWQAAYDAANGKGKEKGFEGADDENLRIVDAKEELRRAQLAEREAKKNITAGAGTDPEAQPKMNIKGTKVGSRARSRHQLSTLLSEAYENRAAIEEKIAEGKRNRKEAGMKYGF